MFAKSSRRSVVMVAVSTILLAGCATANGPQFSGLDPVQQGQAQIYFYRNSALFAAGKSFTLRMDGKEIGPLYNASYQRFSTTLGKHKLEVSPGGLMTKTVALDVTLESNKNYFYEYDFVTGPLANVFFIGASIQPRDEKKALDNLRMLKLAK